MAIDLDQTNFLLRYLVEIVLGLVVILLGALKLLGQRTQAEAMKISLAAPAITQVEMLEYQIETGTLIRNEFDKLRIEMREELAVIHRRVDKIKSTIADK